MLLRRVLEGAKTLIYLYSHASIIIKAECGQFHGVKLRFKSIRKKSLSIQQWIQVPSEWEFKQLIQTSQ